MTVKKRTITNFINNDYKEYAIHTLTSRGIPNFYDSLTPVQRIILLNSPTNTSKTLSVVGNCIADGYHSGNSSIEKSIARLAKPYDCSESLLIGDGFFGNQITQEAASARYTAVKINPTVQNLINKFKFLNKKDEDESYLPIGIDIPIGLLLPTIGIAVGYSTIILPRSLKDIQNFLSGKIKKLIPSFKDFDGNIQKYDNLDNAWLLEGNVEIIDSKKTIHIHSIPPLMKYQLLVKKIDKILTDIDYTIHNNSKSNVDIIINVSNKIENSEWTLIKEKIIKATKIIIRENIVFIKDKTVLEYDSVENYLEDFKIKNEHLYLECINFNLKLNIKELKFLEAKLEYLTWMNLQKKTNKPLMENDIDLYLNKYTDDIRKRLDDIKLRKLNEDELRLTSLKITEYINLINNQKIEYKEKENFVKTLSTKLHTKDKSIMTIYDEDFEHLDDIEIFKPTDDDIEEDVEVPDFNF